MIVDLRTVPATGNIVPLDTIEVVSDFSPATFVLLSDRIARSTGYEQLAYREVELDEIWRLLDASIAEARRIGAAGGEIARLEALRDATMQAHDLVSDSTATRAAAACLHAVT